jgi:hypothetical protein
VFFLQTHCFNARRLVRVLYADIKIEGFHCTYPYGATSGSVCRRQPVEYSL